MCQCVCVWGGGGGAHCMDFDTLNRLSFFFIQPFFQHFTNLPTQIFHKVEKKTEVLFFFFFLSCISIQTRKNERSGLSVFFCFFLLHACIFNQYCTLTDVMQGLTDTFWGPKCRFFSYILMWQMVSIDNAILRPCMHLTDKQYGHQATILVYRLSASTSRNGWKHEQ